CSRVNAGPKPEAASGRNNAARLADLVPVRVFRRTRFSSANELRHPHDESEVDPLSGSRGVDRGLRSRERSPRDEKPRGRSAARGVEEAITGRTRTARQAIGVAAPAAAVAARV